MQVEIVVDGQAVYRSGFHACRLARSRQVDEAEQKTMYEFYFSGGHTFQDEYHTSKNDKIEGDIWEAGADPDAILLGVSFMTPKQVLLNTIHIVKPGTPTQATLDRGILIKTYPMAASPSAARRLPLPSVEEPHVVSGDDQLGALEFPNGSKFQTTLFNLKVIGQLQTAHKLPYYVLSGVGCQECDANVSIYIHSSSDGPMKNEGTQQRFDYPGRVLSRENRSVISKTRMFLGDCAPEYPDAVIWFEHSIGDGGRWHDTVFVAKVEQDHLIESVPKAGLPTIGEAEDAVRRSQCRELPGLDQWEEP